MLSRKWRVKIDDKSGSWWLRLQTYVDDDPGEEKPYWWTYGLEAWRLTPSLSDGLYVVPSFWFKSLKDRIALAVSWAVDVVVRAEGLDRRSVETRRLADEMNEMATKMFEEALAKALGETK